MKEGQNVSLFTTISSDIPLLRGYPIWVLSERLPVPSTAVIDNFTHPDGLLFSGLSLFNLSYNEDSGTYTNIAANQCGSSSVSTTLAVTRGRRLYM